MDTFVGREEDIRNITGYLDFTSSNVQVVHIVGPPGFGKSTLAKQIGHNFLRKGVKVYYADIRAITDLDTVTEKIMLGIVDSMKYKVTFDRLIGYRPNILTHYLYLTTVMKCSKPMRKNF